MEENENRDGGEVLSFVLFGIKKMKEFTNS